MSDINNLKDENPLADLISKETYDLLNSKGLINEKSVRDYNIIKRFNELRNTYSSGDAIDIIRQDFPYLQFDSIRKIIYQGKGKF